MVDLMQDQYLMRDDTEANLNLSYIDTGLCSSRYSAKGLMRPMTPGATTHSQSVAERRNAKRAKWFPHCSCSKCRRKHRSLNFLSAQNWCRGRSKLARAHYVNYMGVKTSDSGDEKWFEVWIPKLLSNLNIVVLRFKVNLSLLYYLSSKLITQKNGSWWDLSETVGVDSKFWRNTWQPTSHRCFLLYRALNHSRSFRICTFISCIWLGSTVMSCWSWESDASSCKTWPLLFRRDSVHPSTLQA